jgi:hypothetical protein
VASSLEYPPWSQGCFSACPPIAAGAWYKHLGGRLAVLGATSWGRGLGVSNLPGFVSCSCSLPLFLFPVCLIYAVLVLGLGNAEALISTSDKK